MCDKFEVAFTGEELGLLYHQVHLAMVLDYKQHTIMLNGMVERDADLFLQRERARFSILSTIRGAMGEEFPGELQPLYQEASAIMLFARGLDDGCGEADRGVTSDS